MGITATHVALLPAAPYSPFNAPQSSLPDA
jgi:hypothetical protein